MKVLNLDKVKHLLALAVSVTPGPLLVFETLKGADQKTITAKSGAVFFALEVDTVPGNTEDSLGLGSLITVDLETGDIAVVGEDHSAHAKALVEEGVTGKAAVETQAKGTAKQTGRTPSERVRNV
jgi:hypothetical protein